MKASTAPSPPAARPAPGRCGRPARHDRFAPASRWKTGKAATSNPGPRTSICPCRRRSRSMRPASWSVESPRSAVGAANAPVARRRFRRTERVALLVAIHGPAGSEPHAEAELLNRHGTRLVSLPASRVDGHHVRVDLPLANLAQAEYVVRVTARDGQDSASEAVSFAVASTFHGRRRSRRGGAASVRHTRRAGRPRTSGGATARGRRRGLPPGACPASPCPSAWQPCLRHRSST